MERANGAHPKQSVNKGLNPGLDEMTFGGSRSGIRATATEQLVRRHADQTRVPQELREIYNCLDHFLTGDTNEDSRRRLGYQAQIRVYKGSGVRGQGGGRGNVS